MRTEKCSACGKTIDSQTEGLKLWESWFCSFCFMSRSQEFNREIRAEDLELLKIIGRELSGLIPPDLLEMIAVGYAKKITGKVEPPPREETLRLVGEIQRLTAFAVFRREFRLLQKWQEMMNEFVEQQERDIRENIKKLTGTEEP